MDEEKHLSTVELELGLDGILQSPKTEGVLESIVRRPKVDAREVLSEGMLDLTEGLAGDNWKIRGSSRTADGSSHPDTQLTIINSRLAALVAQTKERWEMAGDQLYVDLDLSVENLPQGTQLSIGSAVIEITNQPHLGCIKFAARYGAPALQFVNSPVGKQLRLRGVYAKVVRPGAIRVGEEMRKC